MPTDADKTYADVWDDYVTTQFPRIRADTPPRRRTLKEWQVLNTSDEQFEWPGDEWGSREDALAVLRAGLFTHLDAQPDVIFEIGSGAGRYTALLLDEYPGARVVACDVSSRFIERLRARFASTVAANRLQTVVLGDDPQHLRKFARGAGLVEGVDAVVSYDAMVHVDLHTLVVYWVTAARLLKDGGLLAMSVADSNEAMGFLKLLHDAPGTFRLRGGPGGHFQWLSSDGLTAVLERLGFELVELTHANGRDAFFVARLHDRGEHARWLKRAGAHW